LLSRKSAWVTGMTVEFSIDNLLELGALVTRGGYLVYQQWMAEFLKEMGWEGMK